MNVVLLNDTDGRENIGCRLTSATLKEQIRVGLCRDTPSIELVPFPWHFGKGRNTNRVWMSGLSRIGPGKASARQPRFITWLTQLAQQEYSEAAVNATLAADLVVFHPEGSISNHHDAVRIMNLLSLPILACLKRIPTITLNGTFPLYPTRDRRYQMIHTFLQACRFVALRDRITAEHYGVTFMPDTAITHARSAPPPPTNGRPYVLITTGANLSKRANNAIAQAALQFCDAQQLKPLVLTKKHKDLKKHKNAILARGGHVIEQASLPQAEQWLAQCALHIGGRYHMALLGLLLDVPSVLMLTNTHKNRWLAEDFAGIALTDSTHAINQTASQLYPHPERQKDDMRKSVLQAQAIFAAGLTRASGIVRNSIPLSANPGQLDLALCDNIQNQLRMSDFLSFWPFGIRIHCKRKA